MGKFSRVFINAVKLATIALVIFIIITVIFILLTTHKTKIKTKSKYLHISGYVVELDEDDENVADKKPRYLSELTDTFEVSEEGKIVGRFLYNKSTAVYGFQLPGTTQEWGHAINMNVIDTLVPSFEDAYKLCQTAQIKFLLSIDFLVFYSRFFDDRIVASIETFIHNNSGFFKNGKQGFLYKLIEKTSEQQKTNAVAYLSAAYSLGGGKVTLSPDLEGRVIDLKNEFLRDSFQSKPVSFYAESKELSEIFKRDRFLQKPFDIEKNANLTMLTDIAMTILEDSNFIGVYGNFAQLEQKVANPPAHLILSDLFEYGDWFNNNEMLLKKISKSKKWQDMMQLNSLYKGIGFFGYATSPELRIGSISMNDMIENIKKQRYLLKPDRNSGWYDYKFYCLETFIMPEKAKEKNKMLLHKAYKKRLEELFKVALTKQRETHVKNMGPLLGIPTLPPFALNPEFSMEPAPTFYYRTAAAYQFLDSSLKIIFKNEYESIPMYDDSSRNLCAEIKRMTELFYGLYLLTCNELGMNADKMSKFDDTTAFYNARIFLKNVKDEEFWHNDTRIIVPLTPTTYWATAGLRMQKLMVYFAEPPEVIFINQIQNKKYDLRKRMTWNPLICYIPTIVFVQLDKSVPLTRKEWRKECGKWGKYSDITSTIGKN